MNRAIWKKSLLGLLAASVLISASPEAMAKGKDDKQDRKGKPTKGFQKQGFQGKGKVEIKINFADLGQDWDWATTNIARLASMKVFEGYEDGTFRPNKPVTRLEAVVTAVRLMGLREQAESEEEMATRLNFKDAEQIARKYPQAVGYIAVAAENDLFSETEDKLQPEKPADRLWIATMLVKALGLENEAKAKMNTQLNFKDADKIPAGSVGYVAVAVDRNIVFGYENKTFQPNKPVTRAEIAAFLDRAGMQLPEYRDGAIKGTVSAEVKDGVLLLTHDGKTERFMLDPNAFIWIEGKRAKAADLKAGDEITIRIFNNVVIFAEVSKRAGESGATLSLEGTVRADVSGNLLQVRRNGKDETYTLTKDTKIYREGREVAANALVRGDQISAYVQDGKVVWIVVTEAAEANTFSATGLFQGLTLNSKGNIATISILQTIDNQSQTSVYNVSDDVKLEGSLDDLLGTTVVILEGRNQLVTAIKIP
ncbi:S-layer homology domain-containing protein [Xylanibacillus composti]|uniref:SLH domain-containing protein n=1 Tax=Xylanibacillus composti TaxID=1572762 RepID=A0A8J4M225_9BACL|nr:S-layer homology domain-containing protein [Xylanibacillus composti]MDT9723481.1 S-layer homology domain-containing protein [Xylanibacillus composti]GIQ68482.1 hypothetical protein XYCOK13_13060 [Xylanibacillus composti]